MCVGVREIERGCMWVTYKQYQREMRSRETEFCVCERERYFTTRVIARETYQGTRDIYLVSTPNDNSKHHFLRVHLIGLYGVMVVGYLIVYSALYLLEWDIPMSMCVMHILYAHIGFTWFICWTLCAIICWFVTLSHFGQHEWLVMLLEVLTVMSSFAKFVSPWILVGLCMHIYYV